MDKQINICEELSQNFIDFSYEANSCRAFADARDGLKPGQRACLWEMYHKGFLSSKPCVKSAKIAGGVTGAWWPHGDIAIYDTFTRMSQPWINNIPEVDWHGNNGSQIIPDSAAASRYTEARLSKAIEEGMFKGIKKNVVNMIPNYSEDDEWPEVLPAILPRLMVNGCQGIGSTIANVWLPHNLTEIGNIILEYINTQKINYNAIAPDFPCGCQIINKDDLAPIYSTGKGKVILRARAEIKKDHIYFRELPYQVYVEPLIDKIKELITKEELTGIDGIYNRSNKKGIEIDVECFENPETVLKKLYAKTDLQKSYSANQWALVGKTPKLLTLQDYCDIYLKHNVECVKRETQFDLDKATERSHILEGLLRALEDIDNVIALIKKSVSANVAKEALMTTYKFSEIQAKAIIDMKLGKLANLEKIELQDEWSELSQQIDSLCNILTHEEAQIHIVKNRLKAFIDKYSDSRHTQLAQIDVPKEEKKELEVVPENCVVIITQTGEIKRVPASSFKTQNRNTKGIKTESEALLDIISTTTADTLMAFSNKGKAYRISVETIPAGTSSSKGILFNSLAKMDDDEKIIAITSLYRETNAEYVIFLTKKGLIKKTKLEEYKGSSRVGGISAITLKNNDTIANVIFVNKEEIIVITKQGMSIRFEIQSITPVGRVAAGIKAIKLNEDDEILIGLPVNHLTDALAVFSERGFGHKISLKEIPIQARGGKGLRVIGKDEVLSGAALVSDEDHLFIVGQPNSVCIRAIDVPFGGRTTLGSTMIKSSKIKKVIKIKN